MSLGILDLPSPSKFLEDILDSVYAGGCFAYDFLSLDLSLKGDDSLPDLIKHKIKEDYEYEVISHEVSLDYNYGENIFGHILENVSPKPLHMIVKDTKYAYTTLLIFIPEGADQSFIQKILEDFNKFWDQKKENGLNIVILCNSVVNFKLNQDFISFQWPGFQRIDRMMWAIKNQIPRPNSLLSEFAEALAVEIGDQNLAKVSKIVSSSNQDLLQPMTFIYKMYPEKSSSDQGKIELQYSIWKAQLRAFLPWIEECRRMIVKKYEIHLDIDEYQKENKYAVNVSDLEIGSVNFQLNKKGVLSAHEKDLIGALSRIRNKIAHAKVCDQRDLSDAIDRWSSF